MQQRVNKITDEQLIEAYTEYGQLSKIAAKFKVPEVQIWRKCKQLGLTFSVGGARTKIPLNEILEGKHPYYQTLKLKKRLIKEGIFSNQCSECKITEWQGKEIVHHLDHINGDCSDHRLDNLRLLCPNCHSQTHTWCGRNKS